MKALFLSSLFVLFSCAETLPDHVVLQPAAEEVEFAVDTPSTNGYQLVGQVTGEAAANDLESAQQAAKNDIRNKAAALGASLVTIDDSIGEALLLRDKTHVKLVGRAFKALD